MSALVLGLAAGYLGGGRLRRLQDLRLAQPWLAVAAVALQVVAFSPLAAPLPAAGVVVLHLLSYALLVWFVLANRRHRGLRVAGLGMGLNLAAIAANGGYMPASRAALELAGMGDRPPTEHNSTLIGEGTRLSFLGDVFAVPSWVPFANVFSVGDALIIVGVAWLLAAGMRGSPGEGGR